MRSLVLSGATGGIGRAIALEFAAPGRALFLTGRDAARLETLGTEVARKGAEVALCAAPLAAQEQLAAALAAFDRSHPIDLAILAAGVKGPNVAGIEPLEELDRIIDVNLTQTMAFAQLLLPLLRARKAGRVALVGSLAGLAPSPDLVSYSASKAGLRAYAIALRRAVAADRIGITLISPGFIDTAMTRRHLGPTPFLMPANKAARRILRGLAKGQNHIAFPLPLAAWAAVEAWIPAVLSDHVHQRMRARILPDDDGDP